VIPVLSAFSGANKVVGDPTFAITPPTVGAGIPGIFTYSSSNPGVVSITNGDSATAIAVGTSIISALFTPSDTSTYTTATISYTMSVSALGTPPPVGAGICRFK
jgi:hypothetical protein